MGEVKHTPGPWDWVEDRANGGFSGLVGPDGLEVLFPNTRNEGDTGAAWFEDFPSEANARLIAASPDLLEALKAAQTALAMIVSPLSIEATTTLDAYTHALNAEQAARAAIAKATGVEQ